MQFGAFIPQGWRMDLVGIPVEDQWETMLAVATRAERLGYDSIWVYDHFHTVPRPTQEVTWECWTLMAALAVTTERVRLGQMCTCNSYRQPSYMAKVASNVDVLSGGRLDFAIGAGWYEHEYLGYGFEFPKPSVRIGMLAEAVQIISAMFTEDEVTFAGRHYQLEGAINRPKPLQAHVPLWIAGGGEKLTLRVVARYADFANFSGDVETFAHKRDVLRRHCEEVGRDPDEIGLTLHYEVLVAATDKELARKAEVVARRRGTSPDKVAATSISGTPEQVVETLAAFRDEGCSYVIPYMADAAWDDGLDVFSEEVIPQLS